MHNPFTAYCLLMLFIKKRSVEEEYSKLLLMNPEEVSSSKDNMMFKDHISEFFLPWYKTQVKTRTYDNRLHTVNKHFIYFYKPVICDIEHIHVQNWQLKMTDYLKPSYLRGVQGLFSVAIDRAVVLGLRNDNPSKIIGNIKKVKSQIDFWTKEKFEKILSFLYKEDYYQHFLFICLWFLFMTGMRFGEATAIQWEDIDFETDVLYIDKNLYYKNQSDFTFVEPKTKPSIRHIVLIVLHECTLQYLNE